MLKAWEQEYQENKTKKDPSRYCFTYLQLSSPPHFKVSIFESLLMHVLAMDIFRRRQGRRRETEITAQIKWNESK